MVHSWEKSDHFPKGIMSSPRTVMPNRLHTHHTCYENGGFKKFKPDNSHFGKAFNIMCCDNLGLSWREVWVSSCLHNILKLLMNGSIMAWRDIGGGVPWYSVLRPLTFLSFTWIRIGVMLVKFAVT